MQPRSLEQRVTALERPMQNLQDLPKNFSDLATRFDRVETRLGGVETRVAVLESQIVQLRTDMNVEFSAIRSEMKTGFAELGAQMRMLHEEGSRALRQWVKGDALRENDEDPHVSCAARRMIAARQAGPRV